MAFSRTYAQPISATYVVDGYEVPIGQGIVESALDKGGDTWLNSFDNFSGVLYWPKDSGMNPDVTVVYKEAIVNTPGPDMVTFVRSWIPPDRDIWIYGKAHGFLINGVRRDVIADIEVGDLPGFEGNTRFEYIYAGFLDLSDFGVAEGQSISMVQIFASSQNNYENNNAYSRGELPLSPIYGDYGDASSYGAWPINKCIIQSIALDNPSTCHDNGTPGIIGDDFFTANITVTFERAPVSGNLALGGDASESVAVDVLDSGTSHTFTGVRLPANGSEINITASFSDDDECYLTVNNIVTAPETCSVPDCDNDGTLDDQEPDCDNDRIPDDCEVDTDDDGIPDDCDNCPYTANPGQEDTDHDGVGDVCDNCPTISNPHQEDSNGNGKGDACEDLCELDVDAGDNIEACTGDNVQLTAVTSGEVSCTNGCEYPVIQSARCGYSDRSEIWLVNDGGEPFNFTAISSKFEVFNNGTAHYTARVDNGIEEVQVDLTFTGYTTTPPQDSPKANKCGTYDTSDWVYWTNTSGTVVSPNHGTFTISRDGPAMQMGNGGDVSRDGLGASGWLTVTGGDGFYNYGDINIGLGQCVPIREERLIAYQWTTQDGNIIGNANQKAITVDGTGTYTVTATNCESCTDNASVSVNFFNPEVNAGEDQTICPGEEVTLTAQGEGEFLWSTGETNRSITVSPENTSNYTVVLTNGPCEASDEVTVTVEPNVTIGDHVWRDLNENGIQDDGDTGMNGITVELFQCNGTLIETTVTQDGALGEPGYYSFTVCGTEAEYYIVFGNLPELHVFTQGNAGDDDALDSDVDENGRTDCFTVDGKDDLTLDAGLINLCPVAPEVDAGEDQTICPGEEVTLTAQGEGEFLWSTGETTRSITVSPESTVHYTVTLTNGPCEGSDEVTVTVEPNVTIGDHVWRDLNENGIQDDGDTGMNGITVELFQCNGTLIESTETRDGPSGKPGYYSFTVCGTEAEYYIAFGNLPERYVFTQGNAGDDDALDSDVDENGRTDCFTVDGQDDLSLDAGLINLCAVAPEVDAGEDQTICPGEEVILTAQGEGEFLWSTGEITRSITVSPEKTTQYSVILANGVCEAMDDVLVNVKNTMTIGDLVWLDENGNGIQDEGTSGLNGIDVELYTCDGNLVQRTRTANGPDGKPGHYSFQLCGEGGYYYVVFSDIPQGFGFTDNDTGDDSMDSDADASGRTACFLINGLDNTTIDAGLIDTCDLEVETVQQASICEGETLELTASLRDDSGACPGGCKYPILERERCNGPEGDFEIWLRPVSGANVQNSSFKASEQLFERFLDGTARYTGKATNGIDNIIVDVIFTGYTTIPGPGGPQENDCQEYNTSTWEYYATWSGTITSEKHGTFNVSRRANYFQIGIGADVKRTGLGASGWFNVNGGDGYYDHGDVNIALADCAEDGTTYLWTTNDGNILGSSGQRTITIDRPGTYRIEASNCTDCTALGTVVVIADDACNSAEESTAKTPQMQNLYPIPAKPGDRLNIEFERGGQQANAGKDDRETVLVALFDIMGRPVGSSRTFELHNGKAKLFLELGQLPAGQYIVKAQGSEWTDSKMITVK